MYCKTITKEIFDSYIANDSDTVLEGVAGTVDLTVDLIHNHASVAVKEMPYGILIQLLVLIFQLDPAGFHGAVAFLTKVVGGAV